MTVTNITNYITTNNLKFKALKLVLNYTRAFLPNPLFLTPSLAWSTNCFPIQGIRIPQVVKSDTELDEFTWST